MLIAYSLNQKKISLKSNQYTLEEICKLMEHYCVYQERCHKEVEQKLYDYGLFQKDREVVIYHLITHNFLNEERFVKAFVHGKFYIKHWGRIKIKTELQQRNISTFLIDVGFKEIEEADYLDILSQELEKKWSLITEKDPWKRKKKLFNYLMQKGYEYPLIEAVWNEMK